jgi:hypothetical protein
MCVILNTFPVQHWLHERASLLPYTYKASLVCIAVENQFSRESSHAYKNFEGRNQDVIETVGLALSIRMWQPII